MNTGDLLLHESIIGTRFEGRILSLTRVRGCKAIIPEISGNAHIMAISQIVLEPEDVLKYGFSTRIV